MSLAEDYSSNRRGLLSNRNSGVVQDKKLLVFLCSSILLSSFCLFSHTISAQEGEWLGSKSLAVDTITIGEISSDGEEIYNPVPPSPEEELRISSTNLYLPHLILLTTLIVLTGLFWLIYVDKIPTSQALPGILLTINSFGFLFLVTSSSKIDNQAWVVGLVGVIVGYSLSLLKTNKI